MNLWIRREREDHIGFPSTATKVSGRHLAYDDVLRAAEGSLYELGTDYIDLYQVHWPNSSYPMKETMRAMEDLVDRGIARFIGVSNFDVDELEDTKAYLVGSMPLLLEAKEGIAAQIAHMELHQLGLDYLRRFPDLIQAVTAEDIMAATQKHMNPAAYVLSVAGPPNGEAS